MFSTTSYFPLLSFFFFFFQAEDGIRDLTVTGVQTCALPISFLPPGRIAPAPATAMPPPCASRLLGSARWHKPSDRKSTRLNSSHSQISYAVFCLKKKTQQPGARSLLRCRRHLSARRRHHPHI